MRCSVGYVDKGGGVGQGELQSPDIGDKKVGLRRDRLQPFVLSLSKHVVRMMFSDQRRKKPIALTTMPNRSGSCTLRVLP